MYQLLYINIISLNYFHVNEQKKFYCRVLWLFMLVAYQKCHGTNRKISCICTCCSSSTNVMSLILPLSKLFSFTMLVNIDESKHSIHMLISSQIYILLFYVMILVNVSVNEIFHQVIIFLTFLSAFFVFIFLFCLCLSLHS